MAKSRAKAKAFKIRNLTGNKRFGVTGNSLNDLLEKSGSKLCLETPKGEIHLVLEEDGTEIPDDSYLLSLQPQTVIVALETSETWIPEKSKLEECLDALNGSQKMQSELTDRIKNDPGIHRKLSNAVCGYTDLQIAAETRNEDQEWFKGLDKKFRDKETVMKDSAQRRIRGYLRLVQEYASDEKDVCSKQFLKSLVTQFKTWLKESDYHGGYFVRSAQGGDCFCDERGFFECEGPHTEDSCSRRHCINPYATRDARIRFSTWNLDHQIEKSREVLPSLRDAILNRKAAQKVNCEYFYELLFTRQNLKLVDIVCHDKKAHDMKCDIRRYYC